MSWEIIFQYFHRNRDASFKNESLSLGTVSYLLFTGPLPWVGSDMPSLMKFQLTLGCQKRMRLASHISAVQFIAVSDCRQMGVTPFPGHHLKQ